MGARRFRGSIFPGRPAVLAVLLSVLLLVLSPPFRCGIRPWRGGEGACRGGGRGGEAGDARDARCVVCARRCARCDEREMRGAFFGAAALARLSVLRPPPRRLLKLFELLSILVSELPVLEGKGEPLLAMLLMTMQGVFVCGGRPGNSKAWCRMLG